MQKDQIQNRKPGSARATTSPEVTAAMPVPDAGDFNGNVASQRAVAASAETDPVESPDLRRHWAASSATEPRSATRPAGEYRPRWPGGGTYSGRSHQPTRLATALGWFSIGLGVVHLMAPRTVARAIGVAPRNLAIRAIGVREITCGLGILNAPHQSPWLWGRVAGDVLDLGLLGAAARGAGSQRRPRIGTAMAAVAGMAVLDAVSSTRHSRQQVGAGDPPADGTIDFEQSLVINRSAQECYQFWRNFENLPRFMPHLESVVVTDARTSHWRAVGPADFNIEWDAELTVDQPDRLLAWRSLADADVDSAGTVSFEPIAGQRGTLVRVEMQYRPPAGKPGDLVARLFGRAPEQMIEDGLRRFKWLIETGVIPTTQGQSSGQRSALVRLLFSRGEQR